ncbi:MAG: lytic murein transglycosylase, partial [Actinomycetota bacterium]|nr:lytic murein transglycosylase [Actinomycetota bacterium]
PNLSRSNATPWTSTPPSSSIASFTAPAGVPNFLLESFRIPPFLLPIYQAAGTEYGIPWQLLAAINEIETDYGRNLSVSSAGALGWMQFIPSTWQAYGVDANADGKKDPNNPVDAIFAAARYLKAAGGDKDINKAIFAYNHADWYVQSVLVRAKLINAMPADLVGSLTGLTEGHFPVASSVRYAGRLRASARRARSSNAAVTVDAKHGRQAMDIYSRPRAPVIAVNDGVVQSMGRTPKRGVYLVLQDVYGNRFTYSHLGSIVKSYPAPKPQPARPARRDNEAPPADPHPSGPASAGTQRPGQPRRTSPHHAAGAGHVTSAAKERLFAYPSRPAALAAGGQRQIDARGIAAPDGYDVRAHFSVPVNLQAKDVVIKPMRPGARIIGGTILARVRNASRPGASKVTFAVRPAGKGTPKIDPKPILDGWRLLEATDIYRGRAKRARAGGPDGATIGQILLMSKETLARRVLSDPRITIYECGRRDIAAGTIDRRVLATLAFLASAGLRPNASTLKCGHSYFTSAGTVSEHSFGAAVDIASINGIPIAGHQGPGSITDVTVRRLLTLQGAMQPNQLITLMDYPGVPYAWSQGDHADHIHIGFPPLAGAGGTLSASSAAVLKPGQWTKLINRLGQIDNPVVSPRPSRYALPAGR